MASYKENFFLEFVLPCSQLVEMVVEAAQSKSIVSGTQREQQRHTYYDASNLVMAYLLGPRCEAPVLRELSIQAFKPLIKELLEVHTQCHAKVKASRGSLSSIASVPNRNALAKQLSRCLSEFATQAHIQIGFSPEQRSAWLTEQRTTTSARINRWRTFVHKHGTAELEGHFARANKAFNAKELLVTKKRTCGDESIGLSHMDTLWKQFFPNEPVTVSEANPDAPQMPPRMTVYPVTSTQLRVHVTHVSPALTGLTAAEKAEPEYKAITDAFVFEKHCGLNELQDTIKEATAWSESLVQKEPEFRDKAKLFKGNVIRARLIGQFMKTFTKSERAILIEAVKADNPALND